MKPRGKTQQPQFFALPIWVMRHPSFRAASHRARALLLDVGLQFRGHNNGSLVLCDKVMRPLGWNSRSGLFKAKQELLDLGLLVETRRGARPNKASWYALGWRTLDVTHGLDIDPSKYVTLAARKIDSRPPPHGLESTSIRPPHGLSTSASRPPHGRMPGTSGTSPRPPHGQYLDVAIPSTGLGGAGHD